ncbi:DUF4240 domain-containing protein [Flavobacterium nitratireducens]|uniref:DUF4240 domain-containing protein n=1 Tax=Flavobacterium nitratireducens TaxID=992289 RepID=UPI002414F3F5|nr:DUF4240 domain-containing protein [Flavobacterium nitratireducens]
MKTSFLYLFFFSMFSFMHYGQESKVKMDVKTTVVDSVEVPKINLDSLGFKPSNQMIDEDKFWAIIEKSLKETNNQEDQEIYLISALEQVSPQEMLGFRLRTDKLMYDSYTSNLWCANYIISNGVTDDGFDYFRCWLISRGKDAFYKVQENPEYLINIVENEPKAYDFEGFWYVAMNAFKNMTNQELNPYLDYENFKTNDENYPILEFNWNVDEPKTMEKIYPLLFQKFWKK